MPMYFYPRPPWGGRPKRAREKDAADQFLSTPSVGRATCPAVFRRSGGPPDFYPRPPWGGRPGPAPPSASWHPISIHALRGEGDVGLVGARAGFRQISIHALRGEGDFFSVLVGLKHIFISIHALRGEGDPIPGRPDRTGCNFYPRPPWGGRRRQAQGLDQRKLISIHALRGEGDPAARRPSRQPTTFYPRPPWGGRRSRCPFSGWHKS